MSNPWRAYKEWNDKRWAHIRAKGGWHILLHSLLFGLCWGVFMLIIMSAYILTRGRFRLDLPSLSLIDLTGGLVMALLVWLVNLNESQYEKPKGLKSKRG